MKKTKIIKLFITFICVLCVFSIVNNVYGYQLTYEAFYNNETPGYVVLRTMGNTYRTGGKVGEEYLADDTMDSFKEIEAKEINESNGAVPFQDHYQTYSLTLHKQYLSVYENEYDGTKNDNEYAMGYNKGKFEFDLKNNNLMAGIENKYGYVSYKNIDNIPKVTQELDGTNFKVYMTRYAYADLEKKQKITITDWLLSENWLKDKLENRNELFMIDQNNGRKYSYISFSAITGGPDSNGEYKQYYDLNTAYNALSVVYRYFYWDVNRGLSGIEEKDVQINEESLNSVSVGQTIMNLYDNKIIIPSELSEPQEIYIRHVDEDGNLLNISNSQEVLINSSNKESIIANGKDINEHADEYQEYYKINLGESLRVSRSLKMAIDGKLYKYKKAIVSTGTDYNNTKKNDNIKNNSNIKEDVAFEVGGSDKQKSVTIVTFIYSKSDVPGYPTNNETPPNDNPPTGNIHTDFSSDTDTSDCIQKYTPTGEKVTPYLKANKTLLKDLVYTLKQNGDTVNYYINSFNVQKLDGGKVSDNVDKYPETGTIFGNAPYTLFDSSDKGRVLKIKDFALEEANKFKDEYNNGDLPSQSVIDNFVKNQSKSKYEDFDLEDNRYFIPENRYNGLRNPKLSAFYKAVNVLNGNVSSGLGYIDTNNEVNVIVYNPLELEKVNVTSKEIINHTTSSSANTNVIQKNAEFTVTFGTKGSSHYSNIIDTSKYLDHYYLFFDIDIVLKANYQIKERTSTGFSPLKSASAGSTVLAGTLIRIDKDTTEFTAIASSNKQGEDLVSQVKNNVVLIGVTNNMPSVDLENLIFTNAVKKYVIKNETIEEKYINTTTSTNRIDFKSYCDENTKAETTHDAKYTSGKNMYSDAYYFAMARAQTTNVGRIYDFKITDCSDIDYKSVFRKESNTGSVNDLTGVQYFSGVKLFNIYTNEINTLEERENLNISNSSSSKKIIPLGPYKNTNTSYISAPKMGYRISFDLKTSGYYDKSGTSTREISIKPSYYYISKDGTKFINNVNLYYKNSSGKYVNFVGSDYTIYFKPKDGYRSVANSVTAGNITLMSDQLEPLVVGSNSGFTLNSKMMSTADNNFIQAWYGEFKLPNSTIAVEGNNISNPLTDGYIGVKFEIKCIDKDGNGNIIKEISYNQDNQNTDNKINTTQWDYEGFLGFTNYGNEVDKITLQLEKGNWQISNSTYQTIKGSVVLFDTDNRAANDFD